MSTTILLFRQDLRLHDHPALTAAAKRGDVLPVFIYDEQVAGDWGLGGASQWWLHESLVSLSASIDSLGGRLIYRRGNTVDVLLELQESVQADAISIPTTQVLSQPMNRCAQARNQVSAVWLEQGALGAPWPLGW